MTDEDFIELIWFCLIDVDTSNVKYIAVDYDCEIIFGMDGELVPHRMDMNKKGYIRWFSFDANDELSGAYLPFDTLTLPYNYKTVMIKL